MGSVIEKIISLETNTIYQHKHAILTFHFAQNRHYNGCLQDPHKLSRQLRGSDQQTDQHGATCQRLPTLTATILPCMDLPRGSKLTLKRSASMPWSSSTTRTCVVVVLSSRTLPRLRPTTGTLH